MPELRILTVRQPWAWAIIHGGKDVENRPRNIAGSYRGPVAIHAGKSVVRGVEHPELERAQDAWFGPSTPWRDAGEIYWPWHRVLGRIIGVVDLVDVHAAMGYWTRENEWRLDCCTSPWADTGYTEERGLDRGEDDVQHLELANPRPLREPIPFKGALGLRRLDEDTTTQITAALAAGEGMKR